MINDLNPDQLTEYDFVNRELLKYGWLIGPMITGGEFNRINSLCEETSKNEQLTEDDLHVINKLMIGIVFNPNYRAHYMERAQQTMHVKNFSHHLEKALMHYYKEDYFSTVHLLLPAIEGVLLSYYGFEFGVNKKPSQKEFLDRFLSGNDAVLSPKSTRMYREQLNEFLRKWIFAHTSNADFSLSYLNRHYALHGMGNDHYYSFSDCNRLFIAFDMLIEIISAENMDYVFSIETSTINSGRRKYYSRLLENSHDQLSDKVVEDSLMSSNNQFINERIERMKKFTEGDMTIIQEELFKKIFAD